MCIKNLYFYNNSRLLYTSNNPSLIIKGNCGYCFECMEKKSKELNYRSYYEGLDTFNKNGYIIFDTLTYSNEYLPHVNEVLNLNLNDNFSCFNNKHIVDFFKRLRISLQRIDKDNVIKTQWAGEYGTTEGYTHRPHYHIIIYYHNKKGNNLEPKLLSYLISNKWKYGRTDGVKYKGKNYFYNKRCFRSNTPYTMNIYRYVSKYIEKQTTFQNTINDRINTVMQSKSLTKDLNYYEKLEARKLKNHIRQTNRISKNFGILALDYIDKSELLKTNLVSFPDNKYIRKTLTLPLYYKRKLYMNLMYYNIGKKVYSKWIYNKEGRKYKQSLLNIEYTTLVNNTRKQILNSENGKYILELFNNRTLNDYCNYLMFYKNKLNFIKSPKDYKDNLFNETGDILFNYSTAKDKADYNNYYLDTKPIENLNNPKLTKSYKLINDASSILFKDFDKIFAILNNESIKRKMIRQLEYEELKERKERYKQIKYGVRNFETNQVITHSNNLHCS